MNKETFHRFGGNSGFGKDSKPMTHDMAMSLGTTLDGVLVASSEGMSQGNIDMINSAITDVVSKTENPGFDYTTLPNSKTSAIFDIPVGVNSYSVTKANGGIRFRLGEDAPAKTTSKSIITYNLNSSVWSNGGFTVNNIQNGFIHEGKGHITNNISSERPKHAKAYEIQMNHSTWGGTTPYWKSKVIEGMDIQLRK